MKKVFITAGLLIVTITAFGLGTVSTLIANAQEADTTEDTAQTWEEHVQEMKENWEIRQKIKDSVDVTVEKTDNGIVVTRTSDDPEVIEFLHEQADKIESGDFGPGMKGPKHMMGF